MKKSTTISSLRLLLFSFLVLTLSLSGIFLTNIFEVAKADSVIATIPVGSFPSGVAFDSANGDIYATNIADNTVSVVSGSTNTVIGTIPVGPRPFGGWPNFAESTDSEKKAEA